MSKEYLWFLLKEQNFKKARQLIFDPTLQLTAFLNRLPWRISYEYYKDQWIFCWIKIGWFDDEMPEISPYVLDKNGINAKGEEIKCLIYKGHGRNVIKRLIEVGPTIKIQFKKNKEMLFIKDIAFLNNKNCYNCNIEIGNFVPSRSHKLDILRRSIYKSDEYLYCNLIKGML